MYIPGLSEWQKPNVRRIFLPDPGFLMFDVDLKQADAQTVAWEADDTVLKQMFREGADLHTQNAKDIYNTFAPTNHQRQMAKHGVHATNFGATPATLAKKLDMTRRQADSFINRWFQIHPAIKKWQRRIEDQLMQTRIVANRFGYRRIFFGRLEHMLPEALAWIPQSTTVIVIDKGLNNLSTNLPEAQVLLQVHDSLVGQYLLEHDSWIRPKIRENMLVEVPYDDPMTIEVELAISATSWGDCEKVEWNTTQYLKQRNN